MNDMVSSGKFVFKDGKFEPSTAANEAKGSLQESLPIPSKPPKRCGPMPREPLFPTIPEGCNESLPFTGNEALIKDGFVEVDNTATGFEHVTSKSPLGLEGIGGVFVGVGRSWLGTESSFCTVVFWSSAEPFFCRRFACWFVVVASASSLTAYGRMLQRLGPGLPRQTT